MDGAPSYCGAICQPGTFSPTDGWASRAHTCRKCPVGQYQRRARRTACQPCFCEAGRYQATASACVCQLCTAGRIAPKANAAACTACPKGRAQPYVGALKCERCPAAKFALGGAAHCSGCPSAAAVARHRAQYVIGPGYSMCGAADAPARRGKAAGARGAGTHGGEVAAPSHVSRGGVRITHGIVHGVGGVSVHTKHSAIADWVTQALGKLHSGVVAPGVREGGTRAEQLRAAQQEARQEAGRMAEAHAQRVAQEAAAREKRDKAQAEVRAKADVQKAARVQAAKAQARAHAEAQAKARAKAEAGAAAHTQTSATAASTKQGTPATTQRRASVSLSDTRQTAPNRHGGGGSSASSNVAIFSIGLAVPLALLCLAAARHELIQRWEAREGGMSSISLQMESASRPPLRTGAGNAPAMTVAPGTAAVAGGYGAVADRTPQPADASAGGDGDDEDLI
eukprot:g6685.t1